MFECDWKDLSQAIKNSFCKKENIYLCIINIFTAGKEKKRC